VAGPLVFTAGQVAFGPDDTLVAGGVEEQTRQVLDNVERCLASAGCGMDDVVKVAAFLSDLADFEAYNRVYEQRFAAPYPARSTVGARLADGLLVEIEAVALLRQDQ
jgi:2-iminobutanoate/2-iminopropanoate deaminase